MMLLALLVDLVQDCSMVLVSMRTSRATCNVKRSCSEALGVGLARLEKTWLKRTGESVKMLRVLDGDDAEIDFSRSNRHWQRVSRVESTTGTFDVFLNPPRLESLECYGVPMLGVPSFARAVASNRGLVDIRWLVGDTVVGRGVQYVPSERHRSLRLDASLSGEIANFLSVDERTRSVDLGEVMENSPKAWSRVDSFARDANIRVATYNLLADAYGRRFGAPPNEERAPVALGEIIKLDADIVCLQEVDDSLFETFWRPQLALLGYRGDFAKKLGLSREGLATFYKSRRFSPRHAQIVVPLTVEDDPDFDKVNTVALVTVLAHQNDDDENAADDVLVVANAHLYFANKATALRETQMRLLLRALDSLEYGEKTQIIAGDLNAFPDSEAIGLLLDDGFVSAYDMTQPTHHVRGFTATLDYILWSSSSSSSSDENSLALKDTLPLPEVRVGLTPTIPNANYPSDHFLLAADFSTSRKKS